jgi:hypothetical protein
MAKIVFIPFSDTEGNAEKKAETQQWIAVRGGYRLCCYTGGEIAAIKNAGLFDEIYVRGHGGPGDPTIDSDSGVSLQYDVVADRLIASGLSPRYAGCVKIYACQSGTRAGDESSFAQRFAKYLIKEKKRYLCSVYGYAGKVTSEYVTEEAAKGSGDTQESHKWSRLPQHTGDKRVRASTHRKRFYGLV